MDQYKIKWTNSIKTKLLVVLFTLVLFNIGISCLFFNGTASIARNAIYDKMAAQAEYYQNSLEFQIEGLKNQQNLFFSDRKLTYLAQPGLIGSDYERREALLSVQAKLAQLQWSSQLVSGITLYIPYSGYVITPSSISDFKQEDEQKVYGWLKEPGKLTYDGTSLYMTAADAPVADGSLPFFMLYIAIDQSVIRNTLKDLNQTDGSSFWYQPEYELLLYDSQDKKEMSDMVLASLEEMFGEADSLHTIRLGGRSYLVSVSAPGTLGRLIQYYQEENVMSDLFRYSGYFSAFVLAAIALTVLMSGYVERLIHRPLRKLNAAFGVLQGGNMDISIRHDVQDEFGYLYEGFNHMARELKRLIEEVYVQKDLKQKAELKQLQAQINPHFLYNSFFALSRRIKRGDMENAEIMADYLGTYFRFLTRITADVVPLSLEMEHAESYAMVQGARFASRIKVDWETLPKRFEGLLVPRLIVQPLLENAFSHGLEDKEEDGLLRLSYEIRGRSLYIHVEDNGEAKEEQIAALRERLREDYHGEITAISNIHRRLKSYYKGKSGLEAGRSAMGGIRVSIGFEEEIWNEQPVDSR